MKDTVKITKPLQSKMSIKMISEKLRLSVIFKIVTFLISAFYFLFFERGIFFYQENESLFIFSFEYLQKYLSQPGGLLVYISNFLTQGYYYNIPGALIISSLPVILISLLIPYIRSFSKNNSLLLFCSVITGCWLLISQTFYDHFIYHSLGLLSGLVWINIIINLKKQYQLFFFLTLFPVMYYVTGAFSLIYIGLYISFLITNNSKTHIISGIILILIVCITTFLAFKEFIFLKTEAQLLSFPLLALTLSAFSITFYSLCSFIILMPLIIKILDINFFYKAKMLIQSYVSVFIIFLVTFFLLIIKYDHGQAEMMKIEKMIYNQQWDSVIKQIEKFPSKNLVIQYYYNLALSEKGILCDRLFFSYQDFRGNSLSLPHTSEYINRSYYFYYCIGLTKGANYLAFESMVMNGYHPENLKMLIKTEIINGNFKIAERFINILKRTLHYRKWAIRYENMICNPLLVYSDPELLEKIKLSPKNDFFITTDDDYNLNAMLWGNPNNRKAFEYIIARMLLEKDFKAVVYQVKKMKDMGYNSIPRHIGEAILIYMYEGLELPYMGELTVNDQTIKEFEKFQAVFLTTNNTFSSDDDIKKVWEKTYWHYFYIYK